MQDTTATTAPKNSVTLILFASLVGTTIEFFDFYSYVNAAALVFPSLFFPNADPMAATLNSLATFSIAFFSRPIGSALFGHFGDRIGRKATLVAALLTMGFSTVAIGLLPTYAMIGVGAPLLLALCRFGQGLGLGGEWGGAVLLATENAPASKRAWYGMFPQLGAPIGFFLSSVFFMVLSERLTSEQFFSFGWRLPFLASAVLIAFGLYVRLTLTETPAFEKVLKENKRVRVPAATVAKDHTLPLFLGVAIAMTTFLLFYIVVVFTQTWATKHFGYTLPQFLRMQLPAIVCFGATIPVAGYLADRIDRRRVLVAATLAIALFGFLFSPMLGSKDSVAITAFLCLGLGLMGLSYGALGTLLAGLFPAEVRFTGSSLTFNLAGIFGGSLAPYIAVKLAMWNGLGLVGVYLTASAMVTLVALFLTREAHSE